MKPTKGGVELAFVALGEGGRGGLMVNGKIPLYLTLLVMALLAAVLLTFQPYSADWPGTGYTKPAQRYIRAAIRQDSVGLSRLSVSLSPVAWALDAARAHPDTLAFWGRRVRAWTGERRGDTAEVFVYPQGDACGEAPIVLRFVGSGSSAKVLRANSACLGSRGRASRPSSGTRLTARPD